MDYCCAIYGYEITKVMEVDNFILHPITNNYEKIKKLALDKEIFNLTAIVEIKGEPNENDLLNLGGILTFIQQQWVVISGIIKLNSDDTVESLFIKMPKIYETTNNRYSGDNFILDDSFDFNGRLSLIKLCLEKLNDKSFNETTNFKQAFFRNVESYRLATNFIDFSYYLDFTSLEILARTGQNDFNNNVAKVITDFLKSIEFDVKQENPQDRRVCIQTYAHLRNALFHNGCFEKVIDKGNNLGTETLKLTDYSGNLRGLLPYVILKVIGYENNDISWNSWLSRA